MNFNCNNGKVAISLYSGEENFLKEPVKTHILSISNKTVSTTFKNIKSGTYAIGIVHDENNNGKLDVNFMKIPKEAVATSNNISPKFGPPKYEDAKFDLTDGEKISIKISF